MALVVQSRLTNSTSLVLIIVVGLFLALGLSFFNQYLGTRVSGINLSDSVIGGALKSEGLQLGRHTLEFRGRTRDNKQLAHQVSFAVQAPDDGGGGETEVEVARLKFRVDPRLIEGASEQEIAQRLVRYVDDINSVFARGTVRRFVYDPATDFEVWPHGDPRDVTCVSTTSDYSFMIYLTKLTSGTRSEGGYYRCSTLTEPSHVGVAGIIWPAVYSAQDILNTAELHDDYLGFQVFTLIHEMGHGHGLGIGEYYNLSQLRDNSDILPDLDVGTTADPADSPYWSDHLLVIADPMLGRQANYSLELLKFSPLSAEIINRVARGLEPPACAGSSCLVPNTTENPVSVTVETVHAITGAPLPGCQVQMYGLVSRYQSGTEPAATGNTNANGTYMTVWGANESIHLSSNIARLFKVQCPGFQPSGAWLSVFDLQAHMVMPNGGVEGDFRYPDKLTVPLQPL